MYTPVLLYKSGVQVMENKTELYKRMRQFYLDFLQISLNFFSENNNLGIIGH